MIHRRIEARFVVVTAVGAIATALGVAPAFGQVSEGLPSTGFRKVVERAAPSVVTVRPVGLVEVPVVELPLAVPDPVRALIPRGARRSRPGEPETTGSGVVIDAERGGVVTCDHVLAGASQAIVILPDGRERPSRAIRRDLETDLALVVIDPRDLKLTAAGFAEPPALAMGDWAIAIGRPPGAPVTLSAGVFSGEREGAGGNRSVALLEADVRVQNVNRGGALFDLQGRLRGVLTDAVPRGIAGQGYAIPWEIVKRVVHDLGELGYVRRAYLGIQMGVLEPATGVSGVLVQSVADVGPAAEAGIRAGDLVTAIAGKPVVGPGAVRALVEFAPIGEPLAVSVARGETRLELTVKPRETPHQPVTPPILAPMPRGRFRSGDRPATTRPSEEPQLEPIPDSRIAPRSR